ncbi:hypothetical protein [Methylobacterium sp. WL120]|uniref:hypothetical protein n=1 Tax=Methylobacterium sp. WL120 TaxID=2603887 RepID=UPI0011C9968F|nr:hypothetical protein [Methylobacterium sp. WL120]TXM64014.1 hypothetical protein FV229_20150 [Methylobacterium sp. WL120]
MRLVSEQSDEDIRKREVEARKQEATKALKRSIRALAANILRVTRGAGQSYHLGNQMVACLNAMTDYRDVAGCGHTTYDLDQMLDPDLAFDEYRPWAADSPEQQARMEADHSDECEDADREVRRASLQIVASMLVDQLTQQRRGETDLSAAIRRREDAREKRRAFHQAKIQKAPRPRVKSKPPTVRPTK